MIHSNLDLEICIGAFSSVRIPAKEKIRFQEKRVDLIKITTLLYKLSIQLQGIILLNYVTARHEIYY